MESFVDLAKVLQQLSLAPGQVLADFGAGTGFLALEAARRVGATGTVYALDIQEEPLEIIEKKASDFRLLQLKTVRANLETLGSSGLSNESCDWVFLVNVLFQNEHPENLVAEAARILKPQGKILLIDSQPEKITDKAKQRPLTQSQVRELFKRLGLMVIKTFPASSNHYGLILQRPSGLKKLFSFH